MVASDRAASDQFGTSVALSGTLALVGAYIDDTAAGSDAGSAYLFDISTPASPVQRSKLTASDAAATDYFGMSVALSGTLALVGAPGDNSARGSAYLFDISNPASPLQVAKLTASDGAAGDYFGKSVSLSGTLALIGASSDDLYRGSAYLFDISTPASPIQRAKLTASDGVAFGDNFGISVALSGTLAFVGAFTDDSGRGSAYLFDISTPASPIQRAKLTASDGADSDYFGASVSLSGTTALVGGYGDDSGRGSAYLFDVSTPASPIQRAKLTASDRAANDYFGASVSLSGTTALVGAYGDDSSRGSAYLFDVSTPASPVQVSKLTSSDGTASDQFGTSVALSGTLALAGDSGDDSGRGSAYLFQFIAPPTLTSVTGQNPQTTAGGKSITLNGTDFVNGATVTVGGTSATGVTFVSATEMTATAPAKAAGTYDVVVTNPDTQTGTCAGCMTYTAPPTVTSVDQQYASTTGSQTRTVTGTGMASSGTALKVDTTSVAAGGGSTSSSLVFTTPAHSAGAVVVRVYGPSGTDGNGIYTDTASGFLTYEAPPTVTNVSPATAMPAGGTTITVTGTGMKVGVNGAVVDPSGTAQSVTTAGTSAQTTFTAPAHAVGTVTLRVYGPNGTDGNGLAFDVANAFAYSLPPTVTSVTGNNPQNAAGGQSITITGANFTATPTVAIGGRAVTNVTFVSSTTLTVTAPSQTGAGTYDVVVTNPDTQTAMCSECMRYTIEGGSFFIPAGTFSINQGASCTSTPTVTLTLTAEKATDVLVANNQDPSVDGPWQLINLNQLTPTSTTLPWTLPTNDGAHTVHLQYRSASGIRTSTLTQTIILDQATRCGQATTTPTTLPPTSDSADGPSTTPTPPPTTPATSSPTTTPSSTSRDLALEREALKTFTRLFRRLPSSPEDWQVLHHLAYGNAIPRNLAQERAGLTRFTRLFQRLPHDRLDWLMVHVLGFLSSIAR